MITPQSLAEALVNNAAKVPEKVHARLLESIIQFCDAPEIVYAIRNEMVKYGIAINTGGCEQYRLNPEWVLAKADLKQ